MKRELYLIGPADYLPKRKVSNEDVLEWMGSDARGSWIERRTGIRQRRWVAEGEACSDLAIKAAESLLSANAGLRERIRQVILATTSGDYVSPPTAPRVQAALGLAGCGAFDLGAACAGFVTGLHTGAALVAASGESLLLIASEVRSHVLDPADFATTALFGDGAAAMVIEAEKRPGARFKYVASQLFSEGSLADVIRIDVGGSRSPFKPGQTQLSEVTLKMNDAAGLFLKATEGMHLGAQALLDTQGLSAADVAWLVPHQANGNLIDEVGKRLGMAPERVVRTIGETGNVSGASVGIALSTLVKNPALSSGEKILLVSAGGGGVAACALLEAL